MCITDLYDAMRPYVVDLLPDPCIHRPDNNIARLTVVPVYVSNARIIFLLSEGADPNIRALFLREEGQFEMKYLGFTVKEYVARLKKWNQEQSERLRKSMEEQDKLNYDSDDELSD